LRSTKVIGISLLLLAMAIAAVAAYFSITGLAKLFAAALIPVIVMAGTIEAAKLGATFFLHRFWDTLPWWKNCLIMMVAGAMIITSVGIFGFLSKGHLAQEAPAAQIDLQIARIDAKINSYETTIIRENKRLGQLDQVIQKLLDFDKVSGKTGSRAVRQDQQSERLEIKASIDSSYAEIDKLETEKLPLSQKVNAIEAELGPVKYVAELLGFDVTNADGKGKAVRVIIVLLMAVFDPFAILLIVAADWALLLDRTEVAEENARIDRQRREEEEEKERKAEEKREAARLKKEEKERVALEKKEAREKAKEARERQKEIDALALENESKRLDLERKRIENNKLKSSNNVSMHINDGPVEVNSEPDLEIIESEENEAHATEESEIVMLNSPIDVDFTVNDSITLDEPVESPGELHLDAEPSNNGRGELHDSVEVGPVSEPVSKAEDDPECLSEESSKSEPEHVPIIPELEAELTNDPRTVQDDITNESEEAELHVRGTDDGTDTMSDLGTTFDPEHPLEETTEEVEELIEEPEVIEEIQPEEPVDMSVYDIAPSLDPTEHYTEEQKRMFEENAPEVDPLAFIGESFDDDKQLITYLLDNEDVFEELKTLMEESEDNDIKVGIAEVIDAVEERKTGPAKNPDSWLDA